MGLPAYLLNLINDDVSVSADSEDAAYPIENIYDQEVWKVFRSESGTSLTITIDAGAGNVLNCNAVSILNHNFTKDAVIAVLVDGNTACIPAYRQYDIWQGFDLQAGQVWHIYIEDTNSENIQIGQILLGKITMLPRQRNIGGFIPAVERGNIAAQTYGGKESRLHLFQRKTFNPIFMLIGSAHLAIMQTLDAMVYGDTYPFVYIPDVEDPACYYVRKELDFGPREENESKPEQLLYNYQMQLTEEVRGVEVLS